MPQVVLIRPGCTDFDDQSRVQGSIDLPLNERGQQQLRAMIEQLRALPLEVIYASPSRPARCTAEAVAAELGLPIKFKEELRNLDQGLWEGQQVEEIRFKYPKVFRQWQESPETICPPQGEAVTDAVERVTEVLRKPLRRKSCFGVVLSDPLATLVACALTGRKLEIPDAEAPAAGGPRVELLQPQDAAARDAAYDETDSIEFELPPNNGTAILASRTPPHGGPPR